MEDHQARLGKSDIFASPQLNAYLAAWALFHLAEFWITAHWNATRLMEDSFLLQNGIAYHVAHLAGLVEFFVRRLLWSQGSAKVPWWSYVGLGLVVAGQIARSLAMVHAAGSFSHEVARGTKREDHTLVTNGIYAFTRHPSYVGFFYWALGTQSLLGNPLAFCVFAVTLWRFFRHRIVGEEYSLKQFFPKDYEEYAMRVGTGLPFI
ncbi:protein-s-isoprenylcysteine o-methyltransferase [Ceraceosorus bombacis]|uniref:Protein-S-isoprenylcysteine O-methyltransferase n=1 Tax=Ceraceosorus bombacis TaxID=401625 RepID=A0A0P1BHQ5_9BASI|nr:protein-s-isoprenylcysteine o-methyltransferase [Ceraceosorus bombacis]